MENFKVGECPVCGRVNKPISSTVNDVCTTNRYECVKCKEGYTDYTEFNKAIIPTSDTRFDMWQEGAIKSMVSAFGAKHKTAILLFAKSLIR